MTMAARIAIMLGLAASLAGPLAAAGLTKTPIQALGIEQFNGELFIRGDMRDRTETSTGNVKTTESDKFFEEGINLRTAGYVYHPNLMEFDLSLRLGLTQDSLTINNQHSSSQGDILGYNFTTILLKSQPVSFRLFASDEKDVLPTTFARNTIITTSRRGGEVFTKGPVPMSLLFETYEIHEDSDLRLDDKRTKRLRFAASERGSRDRITDFVYEHEDTQETSIFLSPTGGQSEPEQFPIVRDEANLNGIYFFGPGLNRSSFSDHLRLLKRRGFFPEDNVTFDGRLDLAHTKTFSTFYRVLYDNDKTLDETDRDLTGEAGFRQKVYESLDFGGRLVGTRRTFTDGSQDIEGGFLDANYRKKTPIGLYNSTLLLGREKETDRSGTGTRRILGTAIVLTGIDLIQLPQPNIIPGSIVVMDLTRTITYTLGIDYTVEVTGAFVAIARVLPTTHILDGAIVLVDFTVNLARLEVFTTDHFNWLNRVNLKAVPISLYVDYRRRNQNLEEGENPGNLERENLLLLGAEWNWKNLVVTYEHEDHNRILSPPTVSDRIRARYSQQIGGQSDIGVGGGYEKTKFLNAAAFGFEPGEDKLDRVDGFARFTTKVGRSTLLRIEAEYFRTRGRDNDMLGRIGAALEWSYRDLDFSIEARHNIFQQETNTGSYDSLRFLLRRRF